MLSGLAALGAMGTATAQAATLDLNVTCEYPLIGTYPAQLRVEGQVPAVIHPNTNVDPIDLRTTLRQAPVVSTLLGLIGADAVAGSVVLDTSVFDSTGRLDGQVPAPFRVPALPGDGYDAPDFEGTATTTALLFPDTGPGRIEIRGVGLQLTAIRAGGVIDLSSSSALPDSDGDPDTIEVPCVVDPDQTPVLAAFDVVDENALAPTIKSLGGRLTGGRHGLAVISGTNLRSVTSIKVTGHPALVVGRTRSRLIVDLPARPAGTQVLTVTSSEGTARWLVTYRDPTPPVTAPPTTPPDTTPAVPAGEPQPTTAGEPDIER